MNDDKTPMQDRWQVVNDLFEAAREIDQAKQRAFLEERSDGDGDLVQEVLSLLDAHRSELSLLDGVAGDALSLHKALDRTGENVGPYRLVRRIGTGGMGDVYLADRRDGEFEQRVALKIIKRGMDSEQILRRFRAERQILARLRHPNIAGLLDGGVSDTGEPYFAMEYVDGVRIDQYADDRHLSIDERLALFEEVCKAVIHAHANLVVHRDLKPSNILVTTGGAVKLLDFGIAKVLSDEADGTALTRTGASVMTPDYASPEQIRGEVVGTSTDIYSLGVVLYELLAGIRPFQGAGSGSRGTAVPDKPSTAISRVTTDAESVSRARRTRPDRLQKRLRGDLDVICLNTLRDEIDRRYRSVEALLEDIRRHLAGLSVRARGDALSYRLTKFVRRNRAAVAATAIALVVLSLYTVRLVHERNVAESERERAEFEKQKAEQVSSYLQSLFNAANAMSDGNDPDAPRGPNVPAGELVRYGIARLDDELADQPDLQLEMMSVLGGALTAMGDYDGAVSLLERALALARDTSDPESMPIVRALNELSSAVWEGGDYERADSLTDAALRMIRPLVADDDMRLGVIANDAALRKRELGDYTRAAELSGEALAVFRSVYGDEHAFVATAMSNYGLALRDAGDFDGAEKWMLDALELRRKIFGKEDASIANSYGLIGSLVLDGSGDAVRAEEYFRQSLRIRREILGDRHPYVAISLNEVGAALSAQGRYEEAEPLIAEGLDIRRSVLPDGHPHIAYSLVALARVYLATDRAKDAEQLYREALEIRRAQLSDRHALVTSTIGELGESIVRQGRVSEGIALLASAATTLQETLGDDDRRTIKAVEALTAARAASTK